jgi:curved DNA-binding protein CbpA
MPRSDPAGVPASRGSLGFVSVPSFRGDPYRVLDIRHDASADEIKRRWRELAREHHPDRAALDAEERDRLTTRMARINAAYDVLRDPVRRARYDATPLARRERFNEGRSPGESAGPPPPPPEPPVTARFDTSALFRERNGNPSRRRAIPRPGQRPVDRRSYQRARELRASQPNGPVYRTLDPVNIRVPGLDEARSTVLGFGRFHGLTLGEVAEREPTYIDWIAATITRDRDLVMRARVIASDLDAKGVERRPRVSAT